MQCTLSILTAVEKQRPIASLRKNCIYDNCTLAKPDSTLGQSNELNWKKKSSWVEEEEQAALKIATGRCQLLQQQGAVSRCSFKVKQELSIGTAAQCNLTQCTVNCDWDNEAALQGGMDHNANWTEIQSHLICFQVASLIDTCIYGKYMVRNGNWPKIQSNLICFQVARLLNTCREVSGASSGKTPWEEEKY